MPELIGIDVKSNFDEKLVDVVVKQLGEDYPEFVENRNTVVEVLRTEKEKFNRTLENGLKEFEKIVGKLKQRTGTWYAVLRSACTIHLDSLEIICDLAQSRE